MTDTLYTDDPEPADRLPAGLLYVPVRPGPHGIAARMFRTPLGDRTAVGFTTVRRMTEVLGRDQACTRLSVPALRALAEPLGVTALTVDPQLAAPAVRNGDEPEPVPVLPSPLPGTALAPATPVSTAALRATAAPGPGPAAKPAPKPEQKPAPKPAIKPAAKPAIKPAIKPAPPSSPAAVPALTLTKGPAAVPAPEPAHRSGRHWDPQMVGVMRVTAMAAAVEALTLWIG